MTSAVVEGAQAVTLRVFLAGTEGRFEVPVDEIYAIRGFSPGLTEVFAIRTHKADGPVLAEQPFASLLQWIRRELRQLDPNRDDIPDVVVVAQSSAIKPPIAFAWDRINLIGTNGEQAVIGCAPFVFHIDGVVTPAAFNPILLQHPVCPPRM